MTIRTHVFEEICKNLGFQFRGTIFVKEIAPLCISKPLKLCGTVCVGALCAADEESGVIPLQSDLIASDGAIITQKSSIALSHQVHPWTLTPIVLTPVLSPDTFTGIGEYTNNQTNGPIWIGDAGMGTLTYQHDQPATSVFHVHFDMEVQDLGGDPTWQIALESRPDNLSAWSIVQYGAPQNGRKTNHIAIPIPVTPNSQYRVAVRKLGVGDGTAEVFASSFEAHVI